jgi:ADP-ribose pyrophosphatase YjhB (NUDIX family)
MLKGIMMKELYVNDLNNYQDCSNKKTRTAIRGIIIHEGKFAMIQSDKYMECKFPGGGMESGETHQSCLTREIMEETGLTSVPDSMRPYGFFKDIRRSLYEKDLIFEMISYYYFIAIVNRSIAQVELDPYEEEYDYKLVWLSIDEAIRYNTIAMNRYHSEAPWIERELIVLKKLKEEGVIG